MDTEKWDKRKWNRKYKDHFAFFKEDSQRAHVCAVLGKFGNELLEWVNSIYYRQTIRPNADLVGILDPTYRVFGTEDEPIHMDAAYVIAKKEKGWFGRTKLKEVVRIKYRLAGHDSFNLRVDYFGPFISPRMTHPDDPEQNAKNQFEDKVRELAKKLPKDIKLDGFNNMCVDWGDYRA